MADVEDYRAEGVLSESLLQALFLLLRDRWPAASYVFSPHLVRTRQVSRTLEQRRPGTRATPVSLPDVACFPYRTVKSKQWVLYVLLASDKVGLDAKLLLFKRASLPFAASESTTAYMGSFFGVPRQPALRCLGVNYRLHGVVLRCARRGAGVAFS